MLFYVALFLIVSNMTISISCKRFTENKLLTYLLRPLVCKDCGFESHWGHGCLSVMSVVCCQVEVSATHQSRVQRSLPNVMCRCVLSRNLKNEEVMAAAPQKKMLLAYVRVLYYYVVPLLVKSFLLSELYVRDKCIDHLLLYSWI